ncbi:hypothetical protein [Candidatus Cardinium hertigii]|uniref:hypothetical protein n=1 Tax=Candidatus Cardinium hertigii TaxID=247481 RepID=UPI003D7C4FC0
MGTRDRKELKNYASTTDQSNKRLMQDEGQCLDVSIQAKRTKSVLAHTYEKNDNQSNIDLDLFHQKLDNVNEGTTTWDPIASTQIALDSTEGLEKKAKKTENNQEKPMYIDIIDYKPQPISDKLNGYYSTDNENFYEEIIDTESYYETPRSNSSHQKDTDQKLSPIHPEQTHKSEALIYQNGIDMNQHEEPIYEEIDCKKEEESNKNKQPIHQNTSSTSKKQGIRFMNFFTSRRK